MVEIFAYAFGIMYTPGPCNLLSLNGGLNGQINTTFRFCIGVGCAMLFWFLVLGYTGAWLITPGYQLLISAVGAFYIAYLGLKVGGADTSLKASDNSAQSTNDANKLNFKSGLILQLFNPKAFIAILPIVTVQFPAADISGAAIVVWSILLSCMAFGAPGSYLLMGARLGSLIRHPRYFRTLNMAMALLLFYVAGDIAYNHVYVKWL